MPSVFTPFARRATHVALRAVVALVIGWGSGLPALVQAAAPAPKASAASTSALPRQTLADALDAYERGDLRAAERQFRALSRQGVALGDYNLAMMHLRGELPRPDKRVARQLLERAAARGLVRAELALGQFHEQGEATGVPDLVQAQQWYLKAAAHGSVDAQVAVGTAFYLGRGAALDMAEAARWYREAANGGDVGAQYLMASMYESGLGVARDLRLARYWYEAAARNGDVAAAAKVKAVDAALAEEAGTV